MFHHLHGGIGGIDARGRSGQEPLAQHRLWGSAGHDLHGHAQLLCQAGHLLPLPVPQKAGIENHGQPRCQGRFHQLGQRCSIQIGTGFRAVELPLEPAGWLGAPEPEEPFAFHIGAKHHGPRGRTEPGRHGALATA